MSLQITKEDVDSFKTGQEISSCQLTAIWTTQNEPSQLIHKIPLKGTKKPSFFSIILDCDSIPTGRGDICHPCIIFISRCNLYSGPQPPFQAFVVYCMNKLKEPGNKASFYSCVGSLAHYSTCILSCRGEKPSGNW